MIQWAEIRADENERLARPGAKDHHRARASSLRAALAEIDRLKRNETRKRA